VVLLPQHVFPVAADILRRRIPVLLEKPPALTAYQTGVLAAIAEEAGALSFVAFNRRSTPTLVEAKRRMEALGGIDHFVITYSKSAGKRTRPYFDGAIDVLMVDAIHAVDMARWLGGEPEAVAAVTRVSHRDQDEKYVALLRFAGGRTGFLNCVWTSGKRTHEVQMHGNDACAFVEVEREVRFVREGSAPEVVSAEMLAGGAGNHYIGGFVAQARSFLDCVRTGRRPVNDLGDAFKSMRLAERLYHETL
jgi:predicted dehydrogenase